MTTLAEYKKEKYSEIESQANEIILTRLRVVEASQLADELKAETDQGLSSPYPETALYYGKQRSILRGLSESDVMSFDLPTVSEWSTLTGFTLPSRRQFGYIFVDPDGNDSKIYDPDLYYLTRKKSDKTLSTIEKDSDAFSYPATLYGYSQQTVAVNGETKSYEMFLNFPVTPGTLTVYQGEEEIGKDNGNGSISGSAFESATVLYEEKVILVFKTPIEKGTIIKLVYDTYAEVDKFEESYEQIDFTLSQKIDFGQALDLINLGAEVISKEPGMAETMYLRRKSDHRQMGIIQVVCEGLVATENWDPLTEDPEDYLRITHDQFKTFLGYLNPDISNDLTKSSNPEIESNGRKDESYSGGTFDHEYPDIEASPFFPYTDGNYIESSPYTGYFVHLEELDPKWSIHPDIKWQYGTQPSSLGETEQNDPNSVYNALFAIDNFSSSTTLTVPADTGSSSSAGYSYEMVGEYVYRFLWTEDPEFPGTFLKGEALWYSCRYNSLQLIVDGSSGLSNLLTQLNKVISLGDEANTIDTGRQAGDSQFVSDTIAFQAILDTFLTYHNAFDPITTRPTYDLTTFNALVTANHPNGYFTAVTDRLADLETVLGIPLVSGYSKIIYDSCNMATHMNLGYLREVIDELNSIQDLYTMITDAQNQYAMLP